MDLKIHRILAATATVFDVPRKEIRSHRGPRIVADARHAAMTVTHELTGWGPSRIARAFNKKNHTTVICALRSSEDKADTDPDFAAKLRILREKVRWVADNNPKDSDLVSFIGDALEIERVKGMDPQERIAELEARVNALEGVLRVAKERLGSELTNEKKGECDEFKK